MERKTVIDNNNNIFKIKGYVIIFFKYNLFIFLNSSFLLPIIIAKKVNLFVNFFFILLFVFLNFFYKYVVYKKIIYKFTITKNILILKYLKDKNKKIIKLSSIVNISNEDEISIIIKYQLNNKLKKISILKALYHKDIDVFYTLLLKNYNNIHNSS